MAFFFFFQTNSDVYVKCFQHLTNDGTERQSLGETSKVTEPISKRVSTPSPGFVMILSSGFCKSGGSKACDVWRKSKDDFVKFEE